jgi:hypothetical protein
MRPFLWAQQRQVRPFLLSIFYLHTYLINGFHVIRINCFNSFRNFFHRF